MKVKSGSEGRCECYFVLYTAKAGGGKSLDYVDRKFSSCDQNWNQRLMLRKEAVILGTQGQLGSSHHDLVVSKLPTAYSNPPVRPVSLWPSSWIAAALKSARTRRAGDGALRRAVGEGGPELESKFPPPSRGPRREAHRGGWGRGVRRTGGGARRDMGGFSEGRGEGPPPSGYGYDE
eukprot:scaffold456_cov368-Pavlova_lutheri.AAC.30